MGKSGKPLKGKKRWTVSGIFRKSRGEKSDSGWTLYGDNGRRVEERKMFVKRY